MGAAKKRFSTHNFWHIMFPLLLIIIAALWLSLLIFYPIDTDRILGATETVAKIVNINSK